jgi:uncharacterized iron-regulated membrane protein
LLKPWLLRLHRWIALVSALPLLVVLGTGLILSFEPMVVTTGLRPGSLDAARIERLVARHDPQGKARAISVRSYDRSMTVGGGRQGGPIVDLDSGEARARTGPLAELFVTARRLHETLLIDARWLVTASTVAMLALISLGITMGLPRIGNTVAGWHKAMAWFLLPLVILSPLTGLALAYGITLAAPPVPASGQPLPLIEAARVVGASHDLSNLVWLRPAGGRMLVRLVEDGEYRVYSVTAAGVQPMPRNWPRLLHEGNWRSSVSGPLNVLTSLALLGLLCTGVFIWARRWLRRLRRQTEAAVVVS